MSRIANPMHALLAVLGLVICLAGFELTGADLWLEALLFDATRQQWLWTKSVPITHLLFYEVPKGILVLAFLALGAGWLMGAYKMAIGDHFVSHTLVSMLWAWFVINIIVVADDLLIRSPVSSSWPVISSTNSRNAAID